MPLFARSQGDVSTLLVFLANSLKPKGIKILLDFKDCVLEYS